MRVGLLALVLAGGVGTCFAQGAVTGRPPAWAQAVALPGVPNLHKVADGLYRSAQPSAEGMAALRQMGVRTVVNLRSFHSDSDEVRGKGFETVHLYVKAWHPEEKEAVEFLRVATDPKRQPILFHCQHGADRTGAMCAVYRVAVQGWTKEEAIREMTDGGYGFHDVWVNLPKWIAALDFDRLRALTGLAAAPARAPAVGEKTR